jgi:hypothetical protein
MRLVLAPLLVLLLAPAGAAQTADGSQSARTREEHLRRQRVDKAANATPARRDALQRGLDFIEQRGLVLTAREGVHPKIGSLTTGSGFAFGIGYRSRAIFNRYGTLETFAAGSVSRYWALETHAIFPELAHGRIAVEAVGSLREYPSEEFFGLGADALRANQSSFLLRTARVGGSAGVRPIPLTRVGGGVDYIAPRVGRGRRGVSVDARFSPIEVPGLTGQADFLRTGVFIELDYREPLNARQ